MTRLDAPAMSAARLWTALVVTCAIGGGLALWALAGFEPGSALRLVFAVAGAAAVALLIPARPAAAIGVLFLLAVFERVDIETPVGAMRLEQPAIAALLAAVVWHRRRLALPSLRPVWPLMACTAIYLGALALSSILVADQPAQSLRIVVWNALSMTAGLLAALLLVGRVRSVFPWLVGAAALVAAMGLLVGISHLLLGRWTELVDGPTALPRVFFPAYEPNLYASLLAMLVPIAVEHYRASPRRRNLALLALPLLALGLGITRAAYVGLAIGVAVYFVLEFRRSGLTPILKRAAVATAVGALVGLALPLLLLNPQYSGILRQAVASTTGVPGPPPEARPPDQPAEPRDDLETLEYRLVRVEIGIDEWQASPFIGRGAYSYGQRHVDRLGRAEVIAVLPVLVLHDAGIVGLAALSVFLALLARLLWRTSSDALRGPPAIAFAAALAVMLVAYLATTALHFAVTWLIIGCALAAAWPVVAITRENPGPASGQVPA